MADTLHIYHLVNSQLHVHKIRDHSRLHLFMLGIHYH